MPPVQNLDLILADVRALLAEGDVEAAAAVITALRRPDAADVVAALHPADGADVLEELEPQERAEVVDELTPEAGADVLVELDAPERADVARRLPAEALGELLDAMAPDNAADLLQDLSPARVTATLAEMTQPDEVRELLAHDEESAGGLMVPHALTFRGSMTTAQAIDVLRRTAPDEETAYYLFVTDDAERLIGVVSLRALVVAPPEATLQRIMQRELITVDVDADQEECARVLAKYDLQALPIVDADQRLVGIVTSDDVIDVLVEEFNEDYLRLAGSDAEEMDRRTPAQVARLRLPWLLGTMLIELLAGVVIARFDNVLKEVILLASFMPVISAVSGNVGLQAAAIVVRGLDTGHVSLKHWGQQVAKELSTSFLLALVCGAVLGAVGAAWSRHLPFGIIIGGALTCSMLTAGFMGSVIPMLSKRAGFDPATTAGPFETAFQDVIGFAVFLWLASLLLQWLR
jgi:magnesium transporter